MSATKNDVVEYELVVLDGTRYAIVREARLIELCRQAGMDVAAGKETASAPDDALLNQVALAKQLILRRRRAGLTQAELARRAGVRIETLNRIERGKTTPDFSTVRKLVAAMNAAEASVPKI